MTNSYTVWPKPYSEVADETLNKIEGKIVTNAISQQEINLLLLKQIKLLAKHLSEMTELENAHLLNDLEFETEH